MKNIQEYIDSGILELYVAGAIAEEECREVEAMAALHAEVREEIAEISKVVEKYAMAHALPVNPAIKPFLMAKIDYKERIKKGEIFTTPPLLNENSRIEDYAEWLNREDLCAPADFSGIYAKIIGYTPQVATSIIWIQEMPYEEVHDDQYERFLIVEGSCEIVVEEEIYSLSAGSYFSIPLHKRHTARITSTIPCKAILQRVAA